MSTDNTSLDLLHDIVEPAAAAWWPPAPGWQILLGLMMVLLVILAFQSLARWQANRYRREALRELKRIAGDGKGTVQLAALSELLKRTAISAYSRPRVAGLSGEPWFGFLDRSGKTDFSNGPGALLESANYGVTRASIDPPQFDQLVAEVRRWIVQHDRAVPIDAVTGGVESDTSAVAREAA